MQEEERLSDAMVIIGDVDAVEVCSHKSPTSILLCLFLYAGSAIGLFVGMV